MKDRILSLFCAIVVGAAAFLAPTPAAADDLSYSGAQTTSYNGGTNKAVALSTNAFINFDVPRTAENMVLAIDYKFLNAPGAGDVNALNLQLFRGIDSGRYESNAWQTITFAGNSTTANCVVTNVAVGGIAYLRGRIANVSTNSHGTNVAVFYGFKK